VKRYEEVAPSDEEIYDIMDMAMAAYEEWRKVNEPRDMSFRRIFYAAYYLGVLTGRAIEERENNEETTATSQAIPPSI
jgi:hypothetical protein